ncbi:MAG: glycosyltransferase family 2 protein [Myxococcales bacterium]|nr:glycosyltransferase family 2 protein [Myxococcales bacterium]
MSEEPLVSCLMVTRNRSRLAERALRCFAAQTWKNRELVIIDDGDEDYEPVIAPYRGNVVVHYHRFEKDSERRLGAARNLSLDHANGDFLMQWDDDEWYHPERIAAQMGYLAEHRLDGVVLRETLMHMDLPFYVDNPIKTHLRRGTPGTIVHRRSVVRYPNTPRSEDSVYLDDLRKEMRIGMIEGEPHSHLFIRCFHGSNTWEVSHFTERLSHRLADKWEYFKAKFLRRDLLSHRAFQLTDLERRAANEFIAMSREMGLLSA